MDHQEQFKKALAYEYLQAQKKLELAQQLGTRSGFFEFYFKNLSKYQTQKLCFEAVNELHFKIFNEYKYIDYDSFRKQKNKYIKPKK